jgi:CDP-glucose 4,6-dehydratase
LITSSFRRSYYNDRGILLASARAGNVIGGGDWAKDRLVPDIIRALYAGQAPHIRNPYAIRPWQHVLEPLCGYMILAEKLWKEKEFAKGWNFGPEDDHIVNVLELTNQLVKKWPYRAEIETVCECENMDNPYHEAQILKLDSSEAKFKLGWHLKLNIDKTLEWTADWYRAFYQNEDMKEISLKQIKEYEVLR